MPHVVVIDGLIGAGKSTLIEIFAEWLRKRGQRVAVALEPVDKWRRDGALGLFYSDPRRYAVEFQMYVYATRVLSVANAMKEYSDAHGSTHPHVVLLERSVLTDRDVFFRLTGPNVVQQAMYDTAAGLYRRLMPPNVDLDTATFVLFSPSVDECMKRVRGRGRDEEAAGVSVDYQQQLQVAYNTMYDSLAAADKKVIRIKNNSDFRGDDARDDFCVELARRIGLPIVLPKKTPSK